MVNVKGRVTLGTLPRSSITRLIVLALNSKVLESVREYFGSGSADRFDVTRCVEK